MYIGIDIGGTKCAVLKSDANLNIIRREEFATADVSSTVAWIIARVEEMMPATAIGISCGGPLDEEKGIILSPPNLPGWDEVHIVDILECYFSIPVKLRNDANACALAEYKFGAGVGYKNVVFMTFGTGLGAGLILDGKLYSGTNGNAGEVGHIRLAPDGPVGYGKQGSFEGFCSGGGIVRLARIYAEELESIGRSASYSELIKNDRLSTKVLAEMAKSGDADALAVFKKSAEKLGAGLSIIIDLINPDAIVIGSVYSRCRELFDEEMYRVIKAEALEFSAGVCKVLPASLGEKIGDIAAISVAMEER